MSAKLKDIAQRAGVSVGTACTILRHKPGRCAEATRRAVMETANALEYHPSAVARALVTKRTGHIGFILSEAVEGGLHPYKFMEIRDEPLYALLITMVVAVCGPSLPYVSGDDAENVAQECKNVINLVENGHSHYQIVVVADAPLPVRFAAEELQKYLMQITGTKLPVSTGSTSELTIYVAEGGMPDDEQDMLQAKLAERGEDGYLMLSTGSSIVLTGNSPRATLYAVYHFLEKYLGCGWCVPGEDTIPQQATIHLPQFQDAIGPSAFSMRKIVNFHDHNEDCAVTQAYGADFLRKCILPRIDWMAKNRFNWVHAGPNGPYVWERENSREIFVPEVEKRGLHLAVGAHTFNTWLPPDRYAKDHPDYWTGGYVCLSHPDVAQRMAKNMNQWLDENPEVDIVDLWHNDGGGFCRCPRCTPVKAGDGEAEAQAAYTRTYIHFTNRVAALIAPQHPEVLVNFLAYSHVTDCPDGAEPLRDNVLVGLCLFPRPTQRTMRPLETSPQDLDRHLRAQIPAWQKLSNHFYIYEYYTLSNWHEAWKMLKFWSMISMIREDIGYFRRIGIRGLSSDQFEADWSPLNMYAFGKLTWNPDITTEDIIADFCRRYYGPASEPMIAYWNLLEEGLRESWNTNISVDWRNQQRAALIEKALSQASKTGSVQIRYRIHTTAAMHRSYWPE